MMLRPSTKLWVDGYSLCFTVIQQEACIFWDVGFLIWGAESNLQAWLIVHANPLERLEERSDSFCHSKCACLVFINGLVRYCP